MWDSKKQPYCGALERKAGSGESGKIKFSARIRLCLDPAFLSDPLKGPYFLSLSLLSGSLKKVALSVENHARQ
jgi:hypothetical protein